MTRFTLPVMLALCLWIAPSACAENVDEIGSDQVGEIAKRVSDAHNRFGFELFNQIAIADFGSNIFISPASAAFALAMLYNGAAGTTRAEMTQALQVSDLSLEEMNEANAALLASLNESDSSVELAVANSIWFRNTFQFRQDFLDRTGRFYKAEIAGLNFDAPGAADTINDWVKASTRGKIARIVDRISGADVMFLINAVYFKGMWSHPFRKEATTDRDFHLPNGTTVKAPMMQQTRSFQYLETEKFQAIRLPYGTGSFSMFLFLPADGYGLERFIAEAGRESWAEWGRQFSFRDINIVMPRFTLEYDRRFDDPLAALGMKSVFDQAEADLTRLWDPPGAGSANLFVSFVRQKTFLEVNEQGTKAAAVTGIGVAVTSLPPPPVEMIVDRPFFCAIVDDKTGLILFMGAIVDPS